MKKVPNLFERDWNGDKSRVLSRLHEGADVEWVLRGEGVPTIKWDGSACLIKGGVFYVRYDAKKDRKPPPGFEPCDVADPKTGHRPGWIPANGNPAAKWHLDAFTNSGGFMLDHGTYEALGPQHQSNPYGLTTNVLRRHGIDAISWIEPTCFSGAVEAFNRLRDLIAETTYRPERFIDIMPSPKPIEGIVFHHPDGRMAKVLASDLGLPWKVKIR